MESLFENPSFLFRLIRVIDVLGTSFTSVRSVVNDVFRFVSGNRAKSNESNGNDGIAATCLDGGDADGISSFSTFIDNEFCAPRYIFWTRFIQRFQLILRC